ncbi:MAG: nucleotide sugar dehydrogenase [Pseudomonadota bacterium]
MSAAADRVLSTATHVGVIGLGYVGIPLALRMAETGLRVTGFDVSDTRNAALNAGRSPLHHIGHDRIAHLCTQGFVARADFAFATECDALIICVPTPVDASRVPDLSFVEAAIDALLPHLRQGHIIALESTTWPGTTDEVIVPKLEAKGLTVGKDIFVVYSPEREDPGNKAFETRTIPKVIGGVTPACLEVGQALYARFIDELVPVSSAKAAEMVKLLENIHRAVNIGLVNEIKIVSERLGLDIFEVVDAAATKPFGFRAYYPGPGIGGHCIPVDPFYLSWKAKQFGTPTRFIDLAGDVNQGMPTFVADRVADVLNRRGKAVRGAKILALGLAYKPDVDDLRESPSLEVIEILRGRGAEVTTCDPLCTPTHRAGAHLALPTPADLSGHDVAVLLTDHSAFNYDAISTHTPLIVDTRGRFREDGARHFRA